MLSPDSGRFCRSTVLLAIGLLTIGLLTIGLLTINARNGVFQRQYKGDKLTDASGNRLFCDIRMIRNRALDATRRTARQATSR